MISKTDIQERFKQSGLKMTQARMRTFSALHDLNHPTVEEIIQYHKDQKIKTSFQSVYNNLEDFERVQMVKKIATSEGSTRYDVHVHNHCHIHKPGSNQIEDFEDEGLMHVIQDYLKQKKIKIDSIDVIINTTHS